jgi:hypothetical protein
MSGCNDAKKNACCHYKNNHPSLGFYEVGEFIGCGSEDSFDFDGYSSETRNCIPIPNPDKECGPGNSGISGEEIICPGAQKGSWFAKQNKTFGVYGKPESFTYYDCVCQSGTYSEYEARMVWSNNKPEPKEWIIFPNSWSTIPCNNRQNFDCQQETRGSFCAIVGSFSGASGLGGSTSYYPEYGCIPATQTEFNNAKIWSDRQGPGVLGKNIVVNGSWESNNCKERTSICGSIDGCDIVTTQGTRTTTQTIKDCNCLNKPLGEAYSEKSSAIKQIRKKTHNKEAIPIKDPLDEPIDTFDAGDCIRYYLCDGESGLDSTSYKNAPLFLPSLPQRATIKDGNGNVVSVLPDGLRNSRSAYYDVKCEEQSSQQVVSCSPADTVVTAVSSTVSSCIDSFSRPLSLLVPNAPANWRTGPCDGIPRMKYDYGSPCGLLTVEPCHTYTDKNNNKFVVFPDINKFVLRGGLVSLYNEREVQITYKEGNTSVPVRQCNS